MPEELYGDDFRYGSDVDLGYARVSTVKQDLDRQVHALTARITSGNFRLVQRLFAQITRILDINNLTTITREVVETAREAPIIGAT